MKNILIVLVAVAVLFSTEAKSGAGELPFDAGETLAYEVGWKAATAGTLVLKVAEKKLRQSRPAFRLSLEANSNLAIDAVYRVRDRLESWFDIGALVSAGYSFRIEESDKRKQEDVFINVKTGEFKRRKMRPEKGPLAQLDTGRFPVGGHDFLSVLYYFRTLPLAVSKTYPAVIVGKDHPVEIALRVIRKETVKVPAGTFACVAAEALLKTERGYEPHPKGKITVWFTDDKRRIPVQIAAEPAFGRLEAKLIQKP